MLLGKATVIDYDDTSSDQEPIPSECFYTRRTFNSLFGSLEVCGSPYINCYITQHAMVAQS